MKKIFVLFAAVAALLTVSCVKETVNDNFAQAGMKKVTITASVDEATKTTYSETGAFSWTKGDKVSVLGDDKNFYVLTAAESGAKVEFTGEVPEGVELTDKAFYPADELHACIRKEGNDYDSYEFNIPEYKDLTAVFSADLPMGANSDGDDVYSFKHMTGAALLTFSNLADYAAVEITITNPTLKLSGIFEPYTSEGLWIYGSKNAPEGGSKFIRKVVVVDGIAQVYLPYPSNLWADSTIDIVGFTADNKELELLSGQVMKANFEKFPRATVVPYATLMVPTYVAPSEKLVATDLPGLDWASAAVAVNDETATSDSKMKEIRAFIDEKYLYVRVATAQGLPLEADYLDIDFSDGDGPNEVWDNWATTGTNVYWAEHKGPVAADGTLTGMSFGSAEVICHTEVAEESVTWYLAYPRESVEQYVSAKGKIYVSALLWNGWSGYWAVPARGKEMLKVNVFEDPNSLKNADWDADEVVSYDLPSGASSDRQSLRSVKYFADAENIKVRLVASAEKLAEEKEVDGVKTPTTHLGIFLYDVVNGSAGDGYYKWWGNAVGNNEYEGEHVGVITGTDLSLSVNDVAVEVEKVVEGDDVVWMFAIPRSAHENLAANEVNMAFIAYRNWGQTGALPDKYGEMFKVTLP